MGWRDRMGAAKVPFVCSAHIAPRIQNVEILDLEAQYAFDERAAIIEHDAGLSRQEAEAMAMGRRDVNKNNVAEKENENELEF